MPDFSSGAMENWGLINFRETKLLFEDGVSTMHSKENIAILLSHELAHQVCVKTHLLQKIQNM